MQSRPEQRGGLHRLSQAYQVGAEEASALTL